MSRERFPEHVEVRGVFRRIRGPGERHEALAGIAYRRCTHGENRQARAVGMRRRCRRRRPRTRNGPWLIRDRVEALSGTLEDHEHPCSRHFARRDAANPRRNRCRRWPCRVKSPLLGGDRAPVVASRLVSKRPGRWARHPEAIEIMALEQSRRAPTQSAAEHAWFAKHFSEPRYGTALRPAART